MNDIRTIIEGKVINAFENSIIHQYKDLCEEEKCNREENYDESDLDLNPDEMSDYCDIVATLVNDLSLCSDDLKEDFNAALITYDLDNKELKILYKAADLFINSVINNNLNNYCVKIENILDELD